MTLRIRPETVEALGNTPADSALREAFKKFVEGATRDILGRSALAIEVEGWVGQLTQGVSRQTVIICLLNSAEKRRASIREWHIKILREQPSDGQLRFWTERLQSGLTQEELVADLFTSPGSLALNGSRPEPFVQSVFKALLGRRASAGEISAWAGLIEGLVATPREVVLDFMTSKEYRGERIQQWYRTYLRRPATAFEVSQAIEMLEHGHSLESVLASILSTVEYFQSRL